MFSEQDKSLLSLVWLGAGILPLVEAVVFLKRTANDVRRRISTRTILGAVILSSMTLIVGGWILIQSGNWSQPQQNVLWSCTSMLIPLHIGVLIQSFLYWQITQRYRARVLGKDDSSDCS